MKINALISDLQRLANIYGDIDVQLQNDPTEKSDEIIANEQFFIVEEGYENGDRIDMRVNLRTWPY